MLRTDVQDFFGDNSPLKQSGDEFVYEPRPQQAEMALAIAEAFDADRNLCVEAPTGVGKTFAYLVPALFRAEEQKKPVIISTHTISLQEQILRRDIPFLEKLLRRPIRAAIAKGRANYLCLRRLNDIGDLERDLLPGAEALDDVTKLIAWAEKTDSGDQADLETQLPAPLWNAVCAERGNCLGPACPFSKNCFFLKAKRRITQAQLVITNHAFFFSALAVDGKLTAETPAKHPQHERLLPVPAAVVLDEAHTIEDNAASRLAYRAETGTVMQLLNRLCREDRQRGLLTRCGTPRAVEAVEDARRKAKLFFSSIRQWLEPLNRNPLRYTVPGHIPDYLADTLNTLCDTLAEILRQDFNEEESALKTELEGLRQSLAEQRDAMTVFFNMTLPDTVYWMEFTGKDNRELAFLAVPVTIAPILAEKLFAHPPVILTSATLAVNQTLRFYLGRVGAHDAHQQLLGTPFDFKKKVRLVIAKSMPDPRSTDFLHATLPFIRKYLQQTAGRAFVLFTSYRALNDTAGLLEKFFRTEKMTLLKQGDGLSPQRMLARFKTAQKAVIFGTASFWTGVDVPGDALSNVIITKLPFAVPDHPLIEARAERARSLGQNDFLDYCVPEAILKFRQGFGRLIRTHRDTGIVVILDSRIATKPYGRLFLNSIPECPVEYV